MYGDYTTSTVLSYHLSLLLILHNQILVIPFNKPDNVHSPCVQTVKHLPHSIIIIRYKALFCFDGVSIFVLISFFLITI